MTRLDEDRRGERASGDSAPALPPVVRRRRLDPKLLLASVTIACGVVLVGFAAVRTITPGTGADLPEAIEVLDPPPNAMQVPSQTQILVDLADGYTGRLVVDGVEYETLDVPGGNVSGGDTPGAGDPADAPEPGTQVDIPAGAVFDEGRNTITFRPGRDVGFDEFAEGNHQVTVYYWRIVDGEETAQRYTWSFNVV